MREKRKKKETKKKNLKNITLTWVWSLSDNSIFETHREKHIQIRLSSPILFYFICGRLNVVTKLLMTYRVSWNIMLFRWWWCFLPFLLHFSVCVCVRLSIFFNNIQLYRPNFIRHLILIHVKRWKRKSSFSYSFSKLDSIFCFSIIMTDFHHLYIRTFSCKPTKFIEKWKTREKIENKRKEIWKYRRRNDVRRWTTCTK